MLYHILAWLSLLIIVYLCALYFTNKCIRNKTADVRIINTRNFLYRWHKPFGILIILLVFLHGKTAGKRPDALALSLLLLLILLPLSYLLKKPFPNGWMKIHRMLTILLIFGIAAHILLALVF